jgi:biopolymer transport protein ExbB/biopolymer transport protein TolQ
VGPDGPLREGDRDHAADHVHLVAHDHVPEVLRHPRGPGGDARFAPEFSQFLDEDNLTEAITLAQNYKKSHVARVLGNSLEEVKPLITDGSVTVADINSAERAVEREMLMTIVDQKRGLGVLATVGSTAPFVGSSAPRWAS